MLNSDYIIIITLFWETGCYKHGYCIKKNDNNRLVKTKTEQKTPET